MIFTKEFLQEQHIVLKKSGAEIASEFGCSVSNICQHLRKNGILNLSNEYKKGRPGTSSTKFQNGHESWNKGKPGYISPKTPGIYPRQAEHWNWKGGPKKDRRLSDPYYRDWRKAVFERDNYTCQCCGIRGDRLNADHIKSWKYFPELRYELSNGRTLCVPCHRNTDTYGGRVHAQNGVMKSVTLT